MEEATASVVWVLAVELSGMVVADVVLGRWGSHRGVGRDELASRAPSSGLRWV